MNNVVYAVTGAYRYDGAPDSDGFITEKTLKIFVPDLNGRGNKILFRGGEYQFGAETAVIPPAVPHKIENLGGAPAEGITVAIEQPLTPLKAVDVLGWCDNDCIRQAAEQSVYFYNDDCTGREAVLAALGNLIVSYISAFYPDRQSPVTKALREDIEKNLADSAYSAETAIRKLPLNYDYVRKMFKKEVGVSPHDYLTHLRMERAQTIILSGVTNRYSDYTVTQIAEACGFSEPLYFSRVFKKHFGVAPSYYIRQKK